LQCTIGKGSNSFAIELRPGFDDHAGFCKISANDAQILNNTNDQIGKEYAAPGFSNNTNFNKIHVAIVKKGKDLELFINNNSITKIKEAFKSATPQLDALQFFHISFDSPIEKYFISNIKITKE